MTRGHFCSQCRKAQESQASHVIAEASLPLSLLPQTLTLLLPVPLVLPFPGYRFLCITSKMRQLVDSRLMFLKAHCVASAVGSIGCLFFQSMACHYFAVPSFSLDSHFSMVWTSRRSISHDECAPCRATLQKSPRRQCLGFTHFRFITIEPRPRVPAKNSSFSSLTDHLRRGSLRVQPGIASAATDV